MRKYDPNNLFAKILRGDLPSVTIFEDEVALAFMDIMPRSDGHSLVIPKLPVVGLLDMPADAIGPFMQRVQRVAAAAVEGMNAEGLTLQQFNEEAGGQIVFHLHFHILPRWRGAALRPPGVMAPRDQIDAFAARIRAALQK